MRPISSAARAASAQSTAPQSGPILPQKGRLNAAADHHPAIGGSVLLAERSIPRMRFTLARALGHLLANRDEAMVDLQEERKKSPTEMFAAAFASPARRNRESSAS